MPAIAKIFLALGAFAGLLGVTLGAFGAHALRARLAPEMLTVYQTAVQYHFWNALGLIAIALTLPHLPESQPLKLAGWAMLLGLIVFCGSLYLLALSGARWLGAITPVGGAAFIAAWGLYAFAVLRAA